MSIPVSTTTITVKRVAEDADRDPYDEAPSPSVIAKGVRAVISSPTGSERRAGGSQENSSFRLNCDPVDLTHDCTVLDEVTGESYTVVWAKQREGLGLDHVVAELEQVTDRADG